MPPPLAKPYHLGHHSKMTPTPDIVCVGAAHWDVIGHSPGPIVPDDDLPGAIPHSPGGVARNIAYVLAHHSHYPALISAIGQDAAGAALITHIDASGIDTRFVLRPEGLSTDTYLAIEEAHGLFAAIAFSDALETLNLSCLALLFDGRLGTPGRPWAGPVVLDSGLSPVMVQALAHAPDLRGLQLRLTAASPGKAARLSPFVGCPDCSFYLNLAEAGQLCNTTFADSTAAAQALLDAEATRAVMTHGLHPATDADRAGTLILFPPNTFAQRVTGAGDWFMASHIAQERAGMPRHAALTYALAAAAAHVAKAPHHS